MELYCELKSKFNCDGAIALAAIVFTFRLQRTYYTYKDNGVEISGVFFTEEEYIAGVRSKMISLVEVDQYANLILVSNPPVTNKSLCLEL
jgi:hypothetical protein